MLCHEILESSPLTRIKQNLLVFWLSPKTSRKVGWSLIKTAAMTTMKSVLRHRIRTCVTKMHSRMQHSSNSQFIAPLTISWGNSYLARPEKKCRFVTLEIIISGVSYYAKFCLSSLFNYWLLLTAWPSRYATSSCKNASTWASVIVKSWSKKKTTTKERCSQFWKVNRGICSVNYW